MGVHCLFAVATCWVEVAGRGVPSDLKQDCKVPLIDWYVSSTSTLFSFDCKGYLVREKLLVFNSLKLTKLPKLQLESVQGLCAMVHFFF